MMRITIVGVHSKNLYRNIIFCSLCVADSFPTQVQITTDQENLHNRTSSENNLNEEDVLENMERPPKQKRKKFAIMMAYCGLGYYGMQMNKSDLPTIEGTLVSALIKAQCVPETCFSDLKEVRFQRCARTDKGVSALAQVVSLKLFNSCINPVEKINSYLPPEIRVLGVKRVTKGFNSKNKCDGRTYSYTLPTFALSSGGVSPDSSFRLPREDFHEINRLLSFYKGTHNFHNFTNSKLATDKSARRHIFAICCSEPFLHHDVEFTRILVKGVSFMLHQIRKMVCLVIAIAQGLVSPDLLLHSVQKDKVNIPLAPGLGLVLELTHFDSYNQHFDDRALHDPITWEEYILAREAIREETIMPVIIKGELDDLSMYHWLKKLCIHDFMNVTIKQYDPQTNHNGNL
ncbi:pseudouridylate synthase 1 homolog [Mantella aurantiaca]